MFNVDTCYRVLTEWNDSLEHSIQVAGYEIYNYLCSEAEVDYDKRSAHALANKKIAAVNKARFNPINFGIDYHADGYDAFLSYFFDGKKWQFSLYCDDGKTDCSLICKQFGGGSNAEASGYIRIYGRGRTARPPPNIHLPCAPRTQLLSVFSYDWNIIISKMSAYI